jgi:drug/metabolite transporter (DMT)-like permease
MRRSRDLPSCAAMSDGLSSPRGVYSLAVAFLITAIAAFVGMQWNTLEPRWAFPAGTKLMLLAAVVTAALARILGKTQPRATVLTVGIAVPVGAFFSLLLGMLNDPTSQNLWPIAIVVLGIVALVASFIGTFIGSLALRLIHGSTSRGGGT